MSGIPAKHSVRVAGHRTSVSIEAPFWDALKDVAASRGQSLNLVIAEIDATRGEASLSAAIRLAVLEHYRRLAGTKD